MDAIFQKIIEQFDPNLLMLLGLIAGVYYLAWKGGEWSAKIKYSRGKADKSKPIPNDTFVKKSFITSFAKGMAAPVQLYGSFKAPSLPEIKNIEVSSTTSEQALNRDWYKIGADFTNVISKYVSETYPKK